MTVHSTVCPHDCPSCCALEVEVNDNRLGAVRGAPANSYTAGVICAKVSRYGERQHHPDRLTAPLAARRGRRAAASSGRIGWDEALDRIAAAVHRRHRRGAWGGVGVAVQLRPARWGWCNRDGHATG